jgi:hypothetical protein
MVEDFLECRVAHLFAFLYTEIDCTGPLLIKKIHLRNKNI